MVTTGRRTWWAAFGVFGLIGVTWALSIAPMGAPDEIAHSRRAVAVARGQIMSETVWAETPVLRFPRTEIAIPFGYGEGYPIGNELTNCWLNNPRVPASCAPRPSSDAGPIHRSVTYVGAYQPGYYLLVGLPSRWLPPSTGIHAMRIVSALLAAALLASAAVSLLGLGRGPWSVVGFAVALTPTVLFLSGSINPNGLEIAAAAAVWTSVAALLAGSGPVPSRLVARVGVAALVLACARPTSPVVLVAIVLLSLVHGASRIRLAELWASLRLRVMVLAVAAVLAANVVFVMANESLSRVILTLDATATRSELIRQAVERTPGWLDEALGSLAWLGPGAVGLPLVVRWVWWSTLAVVALVGLVRATHRQRAAMLLLAAGCLIGPVVASVGKPQVAWQGRYALPLLIGVPLLAGISSGRSAPDAPWERWLASALVGVLAICQVAAHQQLMVRNLLGLPSGLLRGVLNATWNGPLTPLALLALAGLGSLGFAALCLGAIWRRTSLTQPESDCGPLPASAHPR